MRNYTQMHFSDRRPVQLDELRQFIPSAFADEAHESRSSRYVYIPTHRVLEGLYKEGFTAVWAAQQNVRDASKAEHTKHMVRLRHPDMPMVPELGAVPEIVLLNSHDGTSAYKLKLGVYRLICMNGMISGNDFAGVSVYHTGNVHNEVIEGAYTVVNQAPKLADTMAEWRETQLDRSAQEVLAGGLLEYLYGEDAPIEPDALLVSRRTEDAEPGKYRNAGHDLWTTHNVIQENAQKGGAYYRNGVTGRRNSTRAIRGLDKDVKMNTALWNLSSRMNELINGYREVDTSCELLD